MDATNTSTLERRDFEHSYDNHKHQPSESARIKTVGAQQFEEALQHYAFTEHANNHARIPASTLRLEDVDQQLIAEEIRGLKSQIAEIESEQERLKEHLINVERHTKEPSDKISLSLTHMLLELNESNLMTAREKLALSENGLRERGLEHHPG